MPIRGHTRQRRGVGAAAVLANDTDAKTLAPGAADAAEPPSTMFDKLSEETLRDALESVHVEPEGLEA